MKVVLHLIGVIKLPAAYGMSYFINLGVDNIITDYPAKLVALINEGAALNDVEKFLVVAAEMLKR